MAKEVVKLGMYIGLGGAVTFKNARKPREVAQVVPADKLLIETDCPYMTPVPFRGQRCDSSFIPYTAEVIAEVRNTTPDEILDLTRRNANILFGLEL
jgi:TatD DNase family protein